MPCCMLTYSSCGTFDGNDMKCLRPAGTNSLSRGSFTLQAKQPMEVTQDGCLQAVVDELGSMLSSGLDNEKQLVDLKKGKPNVVMFVGLQVSLAYTCCFPVPTHCESSFSWAHRGQQSLVPCMLQIVMPPLQAAESRVHGVLPL